MTDERFGVALAAPARRALTRLPEKVATAAIELIYEAIAVEPRPVGKPLTLELAGLRSARRGDYRIIYRIDDAARVVEILAIEHRRDVYRPG